MYKPGWPAALHCKDFVWESCLRQVSVLILRLQALAAAYAKKHNKSAHKQNQMQMQKQSSNLIDSDNMLRLPNSKLHPLPSSRLSKPSSSVT